MAALNVLKQQFELADVVRAACAGVGMPLVANTVSNWVKLGHLPKLSRQTPGTGRKRLFSVVDVVQVSGLHVLTSIGLIPGDAAHSLHLFRSRLEARLGPRFDTERATFGDLSLYVALDPIRGEHVYRPMHERETGELADNFRESLRLYPAHLCVRVDQVIEHTLAEIVKIIEEANAVDEQEDEGDAFREHAIEIHKVNLAEAYAELAALRESIGSRKPTAKEREQIASLERRVETSLSVIRRGT